MPTRRVIILGSTGSVGTQALDVIAHLNTLHNHGQWPDNFTIVGLAAGSNAEHLAQQATAHGVRDLALAEGVQPTATDARWRIGPDAATQLIHDVPCDLVIAAIVGAAGLHATLAAVTRGRDVALANKESLVCAGELVVREARRSGSRLLPIDSEHAGVWQCLQAVNAETSITPHDAPPLSPPLVASREVVRVILTASGGPFRNQSLAQVYHAPRAMALAHPTWNMGPKVTLDCATMMNKGLELIEAHWLFGLPADKLGAIIHPQSLIHSLVELVDGSTLAQLAPTDMRMPIQYALTFPRRALTPGPRLNWQTLARLEFQPPDPERFPALGLAMRAITEGGTTGAILNAANEEAVHAYIRGDIPFGRIVELTAETCEGVASAPIGSLADVLSADAAAREAVRSAIVR